MDTFLTGLENIEMEFTPIFIKPYVHANLLGRIALGKLNLPDSYKKQLIDGVPLKFGNAVYCRRRDFRRDVVNVPDIKYTLDIFEVWSNINQA